MQVLACSAIGMSKESKRGTGGDFPESLAGGFGTATVTLTGASSLWWRRSSEVRRPVPLQHARGSPPEALWPVCGICCIILVVSSVCLYWLKVGGTPMGSLLSLTFYIGCCGFEGGVGYGAS